MRRTLSRNLLLGAPIALILALAGQAGGPERSIMRTATIGGVSGLVYYSSVDHRYLAVGARSGEQVAGLDTPAETPQ